MRYKKYSIHLARNKISGMTFLDVEIGWDIITSYDQTGDRVTENSPFKDKITVTYRTDVVQYGLIREDSEWFNYDVIIDAVLNNYALNIRTPFRVVAASTTMYAAIKRTFCNALRNIEIVPDE